MPVLTTPERALPWRRADIAVVGGGVLGVVAARVAADAGARVALFERGGIPSESGATWASPGLVPRGAEDPAHRWARHALRAAGAWTASGRIDLASGEPSEGDAGEAGHEENEERDDLGHEERSRDPGSDDVERERWSDASRPSLEPWSRAAQRAGADAAAVLRRLLVPPETAAPPPARWIPDAGYASAETLALAWGRDAVAAGTLLVLNARVRPEGPTRLRVERLAFERDMVRRVARRETLEVGRVIVAAGAASAEFVEDGIGRTVRSPHAYRQFPRIGAGPGLLRDPGDPTSGVPPLPLASAPGATLRPQGDGVLVIPPAPPPDPAGYRPVGARFYGVRVGLRRESVDALVAHADRLPFLAWPELRLGKVAGDLRGGWFPVPTGGRPTGERIAETDWWVLTGGGRDLARDVATAARVGAEAADAAPPWRGSSDAASLAREG